MTTKRETTIAAGWGFNVDQNFARAKTDTPIEIVEEDGRWVIGDIKGDPTSALGFMRRPSIRVRVDKRAIVEG